MQFIKANRDAILKPLQTVAGIVERRHTLPILANVLISNVPGPPVPLYVDGLRMTGYWPLSIVEHGVGVNITLLSYSGNLCFGFVVAKNAVPEAGELAADFMAAHAELKNAVAPAPTPATARTRRKRAGS